MNRSIIPRALLPLLAACVSGRVDLESEKRTLLELDRRWSELASEKRDVDAVAAFWTDDAVIYPPGQPAIVGQAAICAYVESMFSLPGFHIEWQTSEVIVAPSGDLAYLLGTNSATIPDPSGRLITSEGRGVTVWRKEADGIWRCVVDIWNDAPAEL